MASLRNLPESVFDLYQFIYIEKAADRDSFGAVPVHNKMCNCVGRRIGQLAVDYDMCIRKQVIGNRSVRPGSGPRYQCGPSNNDFRHLMSKSDYRIFCEALPVLMPISPVNA